VVANARIRDFKRMIAGALLHSAAANWHPRDRLGAAKAGYRSRVGNDRFGSNPAGWSLLHEWPLSAHVPPCRPSRRRSLHPSDSGRSGLTPGTALHAPKPSLRPVWPLDPFCAFDIAARSRARSGGEAAIDSSTTKWGLLGMVEIGAVEIHPWQATIDDIERPDMLVFDLDPGEGVGWEFVVKSAFRVRAVLAADDLDCWPKTTGGKGLHIMVPIEPAMTWSAAHDYTRGIAQHLANTEPARYTISAALEERPGSLFIDFLRNGRGTTAVGAYSPRARPPIAAPITWKDVERGVRSDQFTMAKLPRRS
jgi:DNA ligase D-like protein (predicted polymerase)